MPQFKLKSTVGSSDPVGPEDALSTKNALHRLGFLDRPREGFSPYPDQAMFDGIRKFQKQKGLLADSIMKPNGQTAEKIAEDLTRRKPKGAVNDNAASPQTAPGRDRKPIPRPQEKPLPPLYASPAFRNEIARLETGGEPKGGYETDKHLAIGRYQMQPGALVDAGFMTEKMINGKPKYFWKGRRGINSKVGFLAGTKEANRIQELAFDDFIRALERQLKGKGAFNHLNQVIIGRKANIVITESGLVAAAHRQGAENVRWYLEEQQKIGWDSSKFSAKDAKAEKIFTAVETRLRQFQNIPHQPSKSAVRTPK